MRQISQNYRTGELSLVEVSPPTAPSGGILVHTTASLISVGTERYIVDLAKKNLLAKARDRPDLVKKVVEKARREGPLAALDAIRAKLDTPVALGYSMAGIVEEVGRGTHGFARGDRVACAGAGYANHAEFNAVPENLAVRIPREVSDEEASFVTVGAIALHGTRLAAPSLGAVVVVIGLGLIGQLAASFLVAHGCDVVGIDTDRAKVDRAIARGAMAGGLPSDDCTELVRSVSKGAGADAVIIAASATTSDPIVVAGDVARDRAKIVVVGLLPMEIPRETFYRKELSIVVSRSYGPGRYDPNYEERGQDYPIGYVRWTEQRNLEAVLGAIARKRIEVTSLITHRFPFDKAIEAYELITGGHGEPPLGVVLHYDTKATDQPVARPPVAVRQRSRVNGGNLGIAAVGTGSFATSVLLPNLSKIPNTRLVATVSRRGLSARHAAERYGAETAATLDEILADSRVDAIIIATRHDLHAQQAIRSLTSGRDVFLEKPAAIDEEQLRALGSAVTNTGRRILVGFNRRYAPFAQQVKQAFGGRHTGLVMHARINAGRLPSGTWITDPAEGGGRIVGEVCHFIDLFSYWTDAVPILVSAHSIGADAAHAPSENLVIGLTFADGSVGNITYTSMGDASLPKEDYEIFCEGKVAHIYDWRVLTVTAKGRTRKTRSLRMDKGHAAELQEFVRLCLEEGRPSQSWNSVEATTRATFAIELARTEGAAIAL